MLLLLLIITTLPVFAAPVHEAARSGDVITLAALVDSEPAVNLNLHGLGGTTPLMEAAKADKIEAVRFLLIRRANANLTNSEGYSALHHAVEIGNQAMVAMLLESGANADMRNAKGYTPLMIAAYTGRMDIVSTLVEKGANILIRDHRGILPVTYAASFPEIVDYLKTKSMSLENKYR